MSCAAALPQLDRGSDYESERHRFESYTPHQSKSKASGNGGFSFTAAPHGFEPRSRRSRCGSAKRMRGILYAAPIELEASGNGGFSFMPPLHGFELQSRRERLNHHFVKFSKLSLDPSRGHVHNNPCVAALPQLDRGSDYESERHRFESYTPHQLSFKPPETGAFLYRDASRIASSD